MPPVRAVDVPGTSGPPNCLMEFAESQAENPWGAPRNPWQSPYVERLIGSIRRDCLDHVVVLHARHLRRILREYFTVVVALGVLSGASRLPP